MKFKKGEKVLMKKGFKCPHIKNLKGVILHCNGSEVYVVETSRGLYSVLEKDLKSLTRKGVKKIMFKSNKYLVRDSKGRFTKPTYFEIKKLENGVVLWVKPNLIDAGLVRHFAFNNIEDLCSELRKFIDLP